MVPDEALGVVEENDRSMMSEAVLEKQVESIVALGRALSDPIRVRMLGMMAEAAASGRGCCDLPDLGVPAEEGDAGICVCEFEDRFGMGQSKVSYHMRKLKDAGLVREERRGKWSFYSLDREAAGERLGEAADLLLSTPEKRSAVGDCC
jgi:ArsR family transcriptional regulator, arsenate/arsenite/antimonite-responsive transcriptional repressor